MTRVIYNRSNITTAEKGVKVDMVIAVIKQFRNTEKITTKNKKAKKKYPV